MTAPRRRLLLLCLSLAVLPGGHLLRIGSLKVPGSVEEGEDAVLRCDYAYNISEGRELDLKWYFNGSPSPFLLWVPHQRRSPQIISDSFRSHLDLDYMVGNDPYKLYSSIKLKNVNRKLAGYYTCKVSSFSMEETRTQTMTVYVKPKKFIFTVEKDRHSVRLNCSVSEIYPEPKLRLFQGKDFLPLSEHMSIVNKDDYSLSVSHVISHRSIRDTSVLGCSLTLPGTNFSLTEEEVFRKYSPHSLPMFYSSSPRSDPLTARNLLALLLCICLLSR